MKHVFLLNVGLRRDEDFDRAFEKRTQRLLGQAAEALGEFAPVRRQDGLVFTTSDYRFGLTLWEWGRRNDESYAISEISRWDVLSLVRARYVPLLTAGIEYADLDPSRRPLNESVAVLCPQCGWPDARRAPDPYKVWGPAVQGSGEIFVGLNGRTIVKRRVLELFEGVISNQFESGPAVPVAAQNHTG